MDPDTLANLVCVSQHLDRTPEIVKRYLRLYYTILSLATTNISYMY